MVNFKINGRELSAAKGTTILEAAEKVGIPDANYFSKY